MPAIVCGDDPEPGPDAHLDQREEGVRELGAIDIEIRAIGDQFTDLIVALRAE